MIKQMICALSAMAMMGLYSMQQIKKSEDAIPFTGKIVMYTTN